MAAIDKAAFELRVSNHMYDTTKNITGKYQESATDAVCSAGVICVPGTRLPLDGYTGLYNENAWIMGVSSAGAEDAIYACNPHDVQQLTDPLGNGYRVGVNTLGLAVPAGKRETFTRLDEGDHIRVGIGLFTTTIGDSDIVAIVANGKLTPDDDVPTTAGWYFEILGQGTFTVGTFAGMKYADLIVRRKYVADAADTE